MPIVIMVCVHLSTTLSTITYFLLLECILNSTYRKSWLKLDWVYIWTTVIAGLYHTTFFFEVPAWYRTITREAPAWYRTITWYVQLEHWLTYTATIRHCYCVGILCRWDDVTFPPLSFSAYRNVLLIGQFINSCPSKRYLIGWRNVLTVCWILGWSIVRYSTCTNLTAWFQCVVGDRTQRMSVWLTCLIFQ